MTLQPDQLYTKTDICKHLRIHPSTFIRWQKNGWIQPFKKNIAAKKRTVVWGKDILAHFERMGA